MQPHKSLFFSTHFFLAPAHCPGRTGPTGPAAPPPPAPRTRSRRLAPGRCGRRAWAAERAAGWAACAARGLGSARAARTCAPCPQAAPSPPHPHGTNTEGPGPRPRLQGRAAAGAGAQPMSGMSLAPRQGRATGRLEANGGCPPLSCSSRSKLQATACPRGPVRGLTSIQNVPAGRKQTRDMKPLLPRTERALPSCGGCGGGGGGGDAFWGLQEPASHSAACCRRWLPPRGAHWSSGASMVCSEPSGICSVIL